MNDDYSTPIVSIVVITFNSAEYVLETLESVRKQTYRKIELIISDDCSKDSTVLLCKGWLAENSHRFVNSKLIVANKNSGIAPNCNRGWQCANGEWIKFIAGDDALEPNIIYDYVRYATEVIEVVAVFSKIQAYHNVFCPENIIYVKGNANQKFNNPECSAQEQFNILLRENCINAPTVMLRKSVLEELKGFDESFPFLEDWPMWLTVTGAGHKMHFIDIVGVKYRMHAQSVQGMSNRKIYKSRVEMEVDRMFLIRFVQYLPFLERQAKLSKIYIDQLLMKLFGNKNNQLISLLAKTIGLLPSIVLKSYKKRVLY